MIFSWTRLKYVRVPPSWQERLSLVGSLACYRRLPRPFRLSPMNGTAPNLRWLTTTSVLQIIWLQNIPVIDPHCCKGHIYDGTIEWESDRPLMLLEVDRHTKYTGVSRVRTDGDFYPTWTYFLHLFTLEDIQGLDVSGSVKPSCVDTIRLVVTGGVGNRLLTDVWMFVWLLLICSYHEFCHKAGIVHTWEDRNYTACNLRTRHLVLRGDL